MRQINWEAELSDEDKAWARQAGLLNVEDRIAANEARFGQERSEPQVPADTVTRSVLDPTATASGGAVQTANTVTTTDEDPEPDLDDPYAGWTKTDLEDEVNDRNADAERDRPAIEVTGTGSKGAVLMKDLLAALRADDAAAAANKA